MPPPDQASAPAAQPPAGAPQALGLGKPVKACLFDLDGVLTQTSKIHAAAWKQTFDGFLREYSAAHGREFEPFDEVRDYEVYVDGKPRSDGIRSFLGARGYKVTVDFPSVGGLKAGSTVEIAGVEIGRVDSIGLDNYQARVILRVQKGIKLQEDSIASIKTKGLIGEKYVRISPGGSDKIIPPGGKIREVEAPVDFEELLSKYIFGKV